MLDRKRCVLAWVTVRVPDHLPRIGATSARVVRNPNFEPRRHPGLSPGHYALWDSIGPQTTVASLLEGTSMDPGHSTAYLEQLLLLGALTLTPAEATPTAAPMPTTASAREDTEDLGPLSPQEQELLEVECDLTRSERLRILRASRLVARGDYLGLLGITSSSSKLELKRAYFELSRKLHPDRFYNRNLGPFGPLVSHLFETASARVQGMAASSRGPGGPRRRVSDRYPIAMRATIACTSWPTPSDGVVRNVSDHGVFVATTRPTSVGDRVRVVLNTSSGRTFELAGRVAFRRDKEQADARKLPPGIGIELAEIDEPGRPLFEAVLRSASLNQSRPVPAAAHGSRRLARGTGSHDTPVNVIGIDFGTTNTCVAVSRNGRVSLATWANDMLTVPSVVAFPARGTPIVGHAARDRLATDPRHTIASCKRLLGRPASDPHVQALTGQAAFPTGTGPDGGVAIEQWGDLYAPAQLVAYLLDAARQTAERALEIPIHQAVLTVPISYDDTQIEALRRAARLAKLEVAGVIDEPSAAALANREHPEFGGIVGVYDFGGGTFDFSVIDASAGDFRVLGTAGDAWLGGDDFDQAIATAVANQLWAAHGVDLRQRAVEWQQLLFATERAKRALSTTDQAVLVVPDAIRTADGTRELRVRLSRATVERLWAPLIERSLKTAMRGLRRAGIEADRMRSVYLSGGTSLIPAVRAAIEAHFRVPVRVGVPPEHAACLGAGLYASQLHVGHAALRPS